MRQDRYHFEHLSDKRVNVCEELVAVELLAGVVSMRRHRFKFFVFERFRSIVPCDGIFKLDIPTGEKVPRNASDNASENVYVSVDAKIVCKQMYDKYILLKYIYIFTKNCLVQFRYLPQRSSLCLDCSGKCFDPM